MNMIFDSVHNDVRIPNVSTYEIHKFGLSLICYQCDGPQADSSLHGGLIWQHGSYINDTVTYAILMLHRGSQPLRLAEVTCRAAVFVC